MKPLQLFMIALLAVFLIIGGIIFFSRETPPPPVSAELSENDLITSIDDFAKERWNKQSYANLEYRIRNKKSEKESDKEYYLRYLDNKYCDAMVVAVNNFFESCNNMPEGIKSEIDKFCTKSNTSSRQDIKTAKSKLDQYYRVLGFINRTDDYMNRYSNFNLSSSKSFLSELSEYQDLSDIVNCTDIKSKLAILKNKLANFHLSYLQSTYESLKSSMQSSEKTEFRTKVTKLKSEINDYKNFASANYPSNEDAKRKIYNLQVNVNDTARQFEEQNK